MEYSLTDIAEKLKAAREAKNLSQRQLSQLAGVPQSHISKIESGHVDLRVSSLIQLSRALGLELTLVPHKTLPAVTTMARGTVHSPVKNAGNTSAVLNALKRLERTTRDLGRHHPTDKLLAQLQSQIKELRHLRVPDSYLETIQQADKQLRATKQQAAHLETVGKTLSEFRQLRNSLVHGLSESPAAELTRPAYHLDEHDDG